MSLPKRATIYFDPAVHLAEDAEDLEAFEARTKEPNLVFENVLKDLKRRGKV